MSNLWSFKSCHIFLTAPEKRKATFNSYPFFTIRMQRCSLQQSLQVLHRCLTALWTQSRSAWQLGSRKDSRMRATSATPVSQELWLKKSVDFTACYKTFTQGANGDNKIFTVLKVELYFREDCWPQRKGNKAYLSNVENFKFVSSFFVFCATF